jgi:hypothetical protein
MCRLLKSFHKAADLSQRRYTVRKVGGWRARKFSGHSSYPVFNSRFLSLEQQMNSTGAAPSVYQGQIWNTPETFLRDFVGWIFIRSELGAPLISASPCLPVCLESIRMIHDSRAVAALWIVVPALSEGSWRIINLSSYRRRRMIARVRATLYTRVLHPAVFCFHIKM